MSSSLLSVEKLMIRSGERIIAREISFTVAHGEIVALSGASGSGKTTIAHAIIDLLPAGLTATGRLCWEGHIAWPDQPTAWAALRGTSIGFITQDVYGTFDPIMRIGKQMVEMVQDRRKLSPASAREKLQQLMLEVGLQDIDRLWRSYPHQLSGGQLQRCQLCMAMALEPKLLIADEPTSAIDKINQKELLDVFSMLRQRYDMAFLCITHEAAVVRYLGARVISLDESFATKTAREGLATLKEDGNVIAAIRDMQYQHQYGGLLRRAGAVIGPINVELKRGACLGIIGESGSGKSTIAQLLVGLYQAQAGRLQIEGEHIDLSMAGSLKQLRWKIQLVMQDGRGSLHPNFTVRQLLQEVIANLQNHGHTVMTTPDEIAREVQLNPDVLDRKPRTLSGGECLRVSIARALLMEPVILVCDESTSALDEDTADAILALLQDLMTNRQLALVFISHDSRLLQQIAGEILVMADGKQVEYGEASQVLQHPAHEVTRKIVTAHATTT